jgi:hypothetical protein
VQVGPGEEALVLLAAKVLQELFQGRHPLRQPLLVFLGVFFLRDDGRQRPGEPRQYDRAAGEAAPPAEPARDRVHLLFEGVETGLQVVHGGSSSAV